MYNLKGLRRELGKKQSDIAQLFGCVQGNISAQERTNRNLSDEQMAILYSTFGEDVVNKYAQEDEMHTSSIGDNNTINGFATHNSTVNYTENKELISLLHKKDEQIDRLLSIIENLNK